MKKFKDLKQVNSIILEMYQSSLVMTQWRKNHNLLKKMDQMKKKNQKKQKSSEYKKKDRKNKKEEKN